MRKWFCALLALTLAVLVPLSAIAETSGVKTLEELLAQRARLDEEIARLQQEDAVLSGAIDALKEYWKQMYESSGYGDGYLEIRSARVFYVTDEILPEDDKTAHELFDDLICFVEFVLLSDHMQTAPYYMYIGVYDCVALHRDGSYEVMRQNPLNRYRALTYRTDFTGFIRGVSDRGSEFNAVYHLLDD